MIIRFIVPIFLMSFGLLGSVLGMQKEDAAPQPIVIDETEVNYHPDDNLSRMPLEVILRIFDGLPNHTKGINIALLKRCSKLLYNICSDKQKSFVVPTKLTIDEIKDLLLLCSKIGAIRIIHSSVLPHIPNSAWVTAMLNSAVRDNLIERDKNNLFIQPINTTPLCAAARHNKPNLVSFYLDRDADPNMHEQLCNEDGYILIPRNDTASGHSPLTLAINSGNIRSVQALLDNQKTDISEYETACISILQQRQIPNWFDIAVAIGMTKEKRKAAESTTDKLINLVKNLLKQF